MRRMVNAFEMRCYRRILKISWMDRVANEEVLNRIQTVLHFMEDMIKRITKYAGGLSGVYPGLSILNGQTWVNMC